MNVLAPQTRTAACRRRIAAVVMALTCCPAGLAADEKPSGRGETHSPAMRGLYAGVKLPADDHDADRLLNALKKNPHLSGVLLSVPWQDVESAEGRYDFARLDRAVRLVREAGKQYKLKVMPGIHSPDYIYQAGAQRFDTIIANVNRASYGEAAVIPVPWDAGYQRHFSRLIRVLGERYSRDPQCVAVTLTCANYQSAEMHLPKRPEDMETWKRFGLSAERLLKVYEQYLDEWAAAFPRQLVCLHMSKSTRLDEISDDEFAERIIQHGLKNHPQQFAVQSNGLQGRKESYADGTHPLVKYQDRLINGFQSFAGFTTTPDRQGSVEMAVLNFIRAQGEYWELGEGDGLSAELCARLSERLKEAQNLGYEAYKKKLLDAGKYRKAEDDPWPELREDMRRRKDAARAENRKSSSKPADTPP